MPRPFSLREIIADMADRIRRGDYELGERIETHNELAVSYSVSVSTITKAVFALKMMGLLEGSQGRGVYVVERLPDE